MSQSLTFFYFVLLTDNLKTNDMSGIMGIIDAEVDVVTENTQTSFTIGISIGVQIVEIIHDQSGMKL